MTFNEAVELMNPEEQKTERIDVRKKKLVHKMWMARYVAIVAGPQGRRVENRWRRCARMTVNKAERPEEVVSRNLQEFIVSPVISTTTVDGEYEDQLSCWPPPLAMILISLFQVLVHVYMEMNGGNILANPLSRVLLYSPNQRRQAWRFLSYMFVHDGWTHLTVNVVLQVMLALPLEMVHRWWRLMILYLAGVVLGSLGSSLVDPNIYLVGASGGTYAVITAHLANITLNWAQMDYACIQLVIFLIIIFMDVGRAIYLRYIQNIITKVSYAAHFFGALSGLILGIIILRNLEILSWEKKVKKLCIILFVSISSLAVLINIFCPEYFPPER